MSKHDYELLNEIEQLLDTRQASGDRLLDDLANTVPRASANFQHNLENQLIAQMAGDNPMPKMKRNQRNQRRWFTLSKIAAVFILLLMVSSLTYWKNSGPTVGTLAEGIPNNSTVCLQSENGEPIPVYRHAAVDGAILAEIPSGISVTYLETVTSVESAPLAQHNEAMRIRFHAGVDLLGFVNRLDVSHMLLYPCGEALTESIIPASPFEYGGQVVDMLDTTTFLQMTRAGMNWVHINIAFIPEDTQASVQIVAEALEIARRGNLNLLVTAIGNPSEVFNDGYFDGYARWVGELAGKGVDAIEIWSEPNIDRNWIAHHMRGEEYIKLLRPAYNAIKQASPNTIVISAAPAPTVAESAFEGQIRNDDAFLQEIVDSGGLNYVDCVGLHYVEGMVSPSLISGDGRDDVRTRYFHTHIQTYNDIVDNQRPLCITELGYLSGEGQTLPPPFAWANQTTNAQQAQWITEAIDVARNMGNIRFVSIYNMDMPYDEVMQGYSIVQEDGTCLTCERLQEALPKEPTVNDEVVWENSEQVPSHYIPVVIATHRIPIGTQITEDMLTLAYYPDDLAIHYETTSQIDELVGKTTFVEIQQLHPVPTNFSTEPLPIGDVIVPEGKVAVAIPIDETPVTSGAVVGGMPIEIHAVLNTVEVDAEFQAIADAIPENSTETNVVLPAEIIYIGVSSSNAVQGMIMVALDGNDAVILTWLIDAGVPYEIIPMTPTPSLFQSLCRVRANGDSIGTRAYVEPSIESLIQTNLPNGYEVDVIQVQSAEGITWYLTENSDRTTMFGWVRAERVVEVTPCPPAP